MIASGTVLKAEIIRYVPQAQGRSFYVVACPCGRRFIAYAWSWAGHGAARCPNGCKIRWRTLEVERRARSAG